RQNGNLAANAGACEGRAEVERCAERRLKGRPRRPEADGRGTSTGCRSGELRGADRSIVGTVEGVVCFQDELGLNALMDRDVFGNSRIERNEVGKIESVAAESRGSVGAAVAVRIQVRIHQAGVGLSALGRQNPAELPSAEQVAHGERTRM